MTNAEKSAAYKKLIADTQKKYPVWNGQPSTKKVELFAPVVDGENICHEINLYTYWQGLGYAEKTPKIKYLLVAQDWGNFFKDKDFISHIKKINSGDKNLSYFVNGAPNYVTDKNLIKLFEVLGYNLNNRHNDLFFTNFCLGYRSGDDGGGMTKTMMMNDSAEFETLCEILEPENILCLGRLTFECVYESLKGEKINIFGGYGNFIEENVFFTANCGKVKTKIFPLVHCGGMGTAYRNLDKQKLDWQTLTYF